MGLITNTQFIRTAALQGGPIKVGEKIIAYPDLDYGSMDDPTCWLCGGDTDGQGVLTKKRILDTFTDHDLARDMASKSLCRGCVFCLGQRTLRNYSLFATTSCLQHPGRSELRDILLNPPEPPFLFAIAVTGQKHISFKAHIAYSSDNYPVLLEEMLIFVSPKELTAILGPIETLYTEFSKAEIETGEYRQDRIKKFGPGRWEELESELASQRGNRLFKLAIFVAQKHEVVMSGVVQDAQKTLPEIAAIRYDGNQAALF